MKLKLRSLYFTTYFPDNFPAVKRVVLSSNYIVGQYKIYPLNLCPDFVTLYLMTTRILSQPGICQENFCGTVSCFGISIIVQGKGAEYYE